MYQYYPYTLSIPSSIGILSKTTASHRQQGHWFERVTAQKTIQTTRIQQYPTVLKIKSMPGTIISHT